MIDRDGSIKRAYERNKIVEEALELRISQEKLNEKINELSAYYNFNTYKAEQQINDARRRKNLRLIVNAKINENIDFDFFTWGSKFTSFKIIHQNFDHLETSMLYSWILYDNSPMRILTPSKGSQWVKTFKTEKGAKRNLLKYLNYTKEQYMNEFKYTK